MSAGRKNLEKKIPHSMVKRVGGEGTPNIFIDLWSIGSKQIALLT